jgi:hypothetical protein
MSRTRYTYLVGSLVSLKQLHIHVSNTHASGHSLLMWCNAETLQTSIPLADYCYQTCYYHGMSGKWQSCFECMSLYNYRCQSKNKTALVVWTRCLASIIILPVHTRCADHMKQIHVCVKFPSARTYMSRIHKFCVRLVIKLHCYCH